MNRHKKNDKHKDINNTYDLDNLNVIPNARVCNIISNCPKYRFPSNIDFPICRREIAASLINFSNRWCKRENVEPGALKE